MQLLEIINEIPEELWGGEEVKKADLVDLVEKTVKESPEQS